MVTFDVIGLSGEQKKIEVPEEISLSLMEVLKASEYPILATCGGLALCATCRVEVNRGIENIPVPADQELDMLDQLPEITSITRLSCQIRIGENLNGAIFSIG